MSIDLSDDISPDQIKRHVLSDGDVSVAILSLGCITQDWRVPLNGDRIPVVLGYKDPADYLSNPSFVGTIVGRVANRISGASFPIGSDIFNVQVNEAPNHLHGGAQGLHSRNWTMQTDGTRAVQLHLVSPDGDQGYPGQVEFEVTISLSGYTLTYDIVARSDRETPVNLAQHSYYNLMGKGTILDHRVQIDADYYTPVDSVGITTGEISRLAGLDFDLRSAKSVEQAGRDLDLSFVLSDTTETNARVFSPNKMALTMITDQPCLQFYTGSKQSPGPSPWGGQSHIPYSGLCLEPQQFINSVNVEAFPSTMTTPDQPYRQSTKICIAHEDLL
ncbi:MAG: galactose mutarotase [Rhodobacteraceae bacterium]|nr:galactose mutarotase [Paracoccaceae bacterium]